MKNIKFGLRIKETGVLLKCSKLVIKNNEEEINVFLLNEKKGEDWLLDNYEDIKNALEKQAKWFESDENSPLMKIKEEEIEIIQVIGEKKVELYKEPSRYNNMDLYHQNKVEEALKFMSQKDKGQNGAVSLGGLESNFVRPELNTQKEEVSINPISVQTMTTEEPVIKKTLKMKVKCLKDLTQEMGSVCLKTDPISYSFKKGKYYLAYLKNDNLYIMNEDRIPEFICKAKEEEWKDSLFFKEHFYIEEYIN